MSRRYPTLVARKCASLPFRRRPVARKCPLPFRFQELDHGNDDTKESDEDAKNGDDDDEVEDVKECNMRDDNDDKTDDDCEDEDEEWVDKDDDKNDIGNDLKSKRYRKKRKLKSNKSVCTMIEDTSNDDTTPHKISSSNTNSTNSKQLKFITFEFDDGKNYVVRRSLIESFPNTILARKALDALTNTKGNGTCEPIEIERDGARFQFVVDFMRDGNVTLPCSISKEALIRDFKYLGFEVDPLNIQFDIHTADFADHSIHWKTRHEEIMKETKVDESIIEDEMFQNENTIKEANVELMETTKDANDERDRIDNLA